MRQIIITDDEKNEIRIEKKVLTEQARHLC